VKPYQQLLAELKRRHVFKVAGVYGLVAFGLIQVADPLARALLLPDAFLTYVVAVLLLGFPLALVLAWAFEVTPQGVRKTEAATAEEIEAIVAQPASKRWPAGLLAVVGVLALVAGAWWVGRRGSTDAGAAAGTGGRSADVRLAMTDGAEDDRPSLAVLPFADMSPEGDQEYFSDGITEEILNVLAKVREMRLSARTSAFAFKGHDLTAEQLGDTLRVRYLVEGSVRKAGNRLRITAQLIDAATGSHLWSEQYDRELEDVFVIQTEIAEAIAAELRVPLGLEDDQTLVSPTGDLTAYDLYLAGRTKMRERGPSLPEAIRLFEAAIARDSNWAPAWAALAETREISVWYLDQFGESDEDTEASERFLVQAETAARRAIELDPRNASALVAMGSVLRDRHQADEAEAFYRRALALDPDNPEAYHQYGEMLYETGRIAEAVRALDRATTLDPAPVRIFLLGLALELDDRRSEAVEVYELGLASDPEIRIPQLWWSAAAAYIEAGMAEPAIDALVTLTQAAPPPADGDPVPTPERIERTVRAIVDREPDRIPPEVRDVLSPEWWMLLDDREQALENLRRLNDAFALRWAPGYWLPVWDSLRSDPEFQELFADKGVGGTDIRRTPVEERVRPTVLQRLEPR
jgi:TolB-like protein